MKKYSGRTGGKHARFTYAEMCYAAEDYDNAIANFNQSLVDFNDEPFLKNLTLTVLVILIRRKKITKPQPNILK